jgi:hypothetical protein
MAATTTESLCAVTADAVAAGARVLVQGAREAHAAHNPHDAQAA